MAKQRHGHHVGKPTRTYTAWVNMHARCKGNDERNVPNYVERGITVCERWNSFENFLSDMGEAPEYKTLDRIDNNIGYSLSNCRWASRSEQARNRRKPMAQKFIEFGGTKLSAAQWEDKMGLSRGLLYHRIVRMKWPLERALTEPMRRHSLL